MCTMWYYSKHKGWEDLCSNTAVNEWTTEWDSLIHADEGTWRHLVLTKKKDQLQKMEHFQNCAVTEWWYSVKWNIFSDNINNSVYVMQLSCSLTRIRIHFTAALRMSICRRVLSPGVNVFWTCMLHFHMGQSVSTAAASVLKIVLMLLTW